MERWTTTHVITGRGGPRRDTSPGPRPRVVLDKRAMKARLVAIAEARGVTITELARRVGLSRQWVDWELGNKGGITFTSAVMLAHLAGVPLGDFYQGCVHVITGKEKQDETAGVPAGEAGAAR